MSLFSQLIKGVLSGAGWTAGKKLADDGIDMLREKIKEQKEKKEKKEDGNEEDALNNIEIKEEDDSLK